MRLEPDDERRLSLDGHDGLHRSLKLIFDHAEHPLPITDVYSGNRTYRNKRTRSRPFESRGCRKKHASLAWYGGARSQPRLKIALPTLEC